MKNFLFICSYNQLRSPTAETVFSTYPGINTRSAGLREDAIHRLDSEDIEWADCIFVMEKHHKEKLMNNYNQFLKNKKIIVLDIPDNYGYMDDKLIEILKSKVSKYL